MPRITSPRASSNVLPCSLEMIRASSSVCSSISARNLNITRARRVTDVSLQPTKASLAFCTAASTSAGSARVSSRWTSPVAGSSPAPFADRPASRHPRSHVVTGLDEHSPSRSTISSSSAASLISGGAICSTLSPRSSARAISPPRAAGAGRKPRSSSSRSAWSSACVVLLDELDRPEEAGAADVADDRQLAQRAQLRLEVRLQRADVLEHAVALEDVDVRERDRGAQRVAAERDAVAEDAAAIGATSRSRATTAPIGAYADVSPLASETRSGTTPRGSTPNHSPSRPAAGDDLVGHQQRAVPVGELAQARPVAGRRRRGSRRSSAPARR